MIITLIVCEDWGVYVEYIVRVRVYSFAVWMHEYESLLLNGYTLNGVKLFVMDAAIKFMLDLVR